MLVLSDYLFVAAIIFGLGVAGVIINRKNIIVLLMSIELILLAVNINFVAFSSFMNNLVGEVFVFFILGVAASEAAIGLAILITVFRTQKNINVHELNHLKG